MLNKFLNFYYEIQNVRMKLHVLSSYEPLANLVSTIFLPTFPSCIILNQVPDI